MTASLPQDIRDRILSHPADFLSLVSKALDEPAELFTLVDKNHPLPSDYSPGDLSRVSREYHLAVTWGEVMVSRVIIPSLADLMRAAGAEGAYLSVSSGYRSFAYQQEVYAREVSMYGSQIADRESARPGMSQHQLGTAIDFGSITDEFAGTPAGRFLLAHAWEYGFSLSYPRGLEQVTGYRYESWHYRYITRAGTALQREFFDDVQQYLLAFLDENQAALRTKRTK
jgi:D-alanyl-D-alanine carboxypeptidase